MPQARSKNGWPLLGETLNLLSGPTNWSLDMVKMAGKDKIIMTNLFMQTTAVICGEEGLRTFMDDKIISRSGSAPSFIVEILLNNQKRVSPNLHQEAHAHRKKLLLSYLSEQNTSTKFLTVLDKLILTEISALNENSVNKEIDLFEILEKVVAAYFCKIFFSFDMTEEVYGLFKTMLGGLDGLPINLWFNAFGRAVTAKNKLFEFYQSQYQKHLENKNLDDAMGFFIQHLDETFSSDEMLVELHHLIFAGIIASNVACNVLLGIIHHQTVHEKLSMEFKATTFDLKSFKSFPYLLNTVREGIRYYPVIPIQFGIAIDDFEFNGYKVSKGSQVACPYFGANMDPERFMDPLEFNPDRFSNQSESVSKITTFGYLDSSKTHRCAGETVATSSVTLLVARLFQAFKFKLVDPNQSLDLAPFICKPLNGFKVYCERKIQ